jgi:hypothetical protein
MEKAKIMEQRYGGNDSVSVGDGMSIFGGQSIDVRRRSKLRRRATHKVRVSGNVYLAKLRRLY